jgi:Lon protease-like protein
MSMPIVSHFSYPSEFVTRVRKTFPDDRELHEQIDSGSVYSVEQKLKRVSPVLHAEFQDLWQRRNELGRSAPLY